MDFTVFRIVFLEYAAIVTTVINGMANRYITVAYSRGEIENANRYFTSVTVVNIVLTVILAIPAAAVSYAAGFFLVFSRNEQKRAIAAVQEKLQKGD